MSDEVKTTEAEVVQQVQGKTVMSVTLPTPRWATWMFRTQFILNKALMFYLTGTDRVPSSSLKEIILIMAAIDLATWMFANSIGIKPKDIGLPDTQ